MIPPPPHDPEVLYRKPGTVTAAQVFLWLQFSTLLLFGLVTAAIFLFVADLVHVISENLAEDHAINADDFLSDMLTIAIVTFASAIVFAILAAKLGAGRRWAQVATIIVMLLIFLWGCVAALSRFNEMAAPGVTMNSAGVLIVASALAMPGITLICLCTGSANHWFRQGGRNPLRYPTMGYSPYPRV